MLKKQRYYLGGKIMLLNSKIEPFIGVGDFKLYMTVEEAKAIIRKLKAKFSTELWSNKGCSPNVPWLIIRVENSINLFFAKNRLFKIYVENDFVGKMDNGICINMPMEKVFEKDPTLEFDDWNEVYQSKNGYWIEDNLDDKTVLTISVFIPEILDDEIFDSYDWVDK